MEINNRIIKFRIWDFSEKNWMKPDGESMWASPDYCASFEVILANRTRFRVQQFTGLLDKNGKEIYEGDLVNFTIPGITHGPEREDLTSQEVHWAQEEGSWAFGRWLNTDGELTYFTIVGDRIDVKTLEIVGNIFENK